MFATIFTRFFFLTIENFENNIFKVPQLDKMFNLMRTKP